jgi:hypothetical protein
VRFPGRGCRLLALCAAFLESRVRPDAHDRVLVAACNRRRPAEATFPGHIPASAVCSLLSTNATSEAVLPRLSSRECQEPGSIQSKLHVFRGNVTICLCGLHPDWRT